MEKVKLSVFLPIPWTTEGCLQRLTHITQTLLGNHVKRNYLYGRFTRCFVTHHASRITHHVSRITHHVSRQNLFLAAALLIAGAAAWPLLAEPGLLNTRGGGDSPFLLQRLHQLEAALRDGHFPARWMPDANYGYGYPFYNFYAPLSIYVAAVFRLIGFSYVRAIHLAQLLGFLAAAWGMFHLGRRWLGNNWAGLLAAVAYTFAPFHLVNVYVRGDSLAEFWAMAFYPLVILAAGELASWRVGELASGRVGEWASSLVCPGLRRSYSQPQHLRPHLHAVPASLHPAPLASRITHHASRTTHQSPVSSPHPLRLAPCPGPIGLVLPAGAGRAIAGPTGSSHKWLLSFQ